MNGRHLALWAKWHPLVICSRPFMKFCSFIKNRRFRLHLLKFRINLILCLLHCRYGFCLSRKCLTLFVRRCLIRFRLFNYQRELAAKYGRNWRLCLFNNEVVQFLKARDYIHRIIKPSSAHETNGLIRSIKGLRLSQRLPPSSKHGRSVQLPSQVLPANSDESGRSCKT